MIFSQERSNKLNPKKIFIAKTEVVSNHSENDDFGPRYTIMYFAVQKNGQEFQEVFSGVTIKENKHGMQYFNTPYIDEIEPLTNYMKKPWKNKIDKEVLFHWVVQMNTVQKLGLLEDEE